MLMAMSGGNSSARSASCQSSVCPDSDQSTIRIIGSAVSPLSESMLVHRWITGDGEAIIVASPPGYFRWIAILNPPIRLFGGSEHPKIILGNRPRRRPPIVEEKRDVFACTGFFRVSRYVRAGYAEPLSSPSRNNDGLALF